MTKEGRELMPGLYEIYTETSFSAAHALRGYEGDCARLHGHNWTIRVYVRCRALDDTGMGVDFRVIRESVEDVLRTLDHSHLNDLEPFQKVNPTAENIARYLYGELGRRINSEDARISKIGVSETADAGAFYWED